MSKNVVTDPRFNKVHNDPRFAQNSKKKNKVQLDKRFQGVLTDKKFQSVHGKYDKYGRRVDKQENDMKKFYNVEDDDGDNDDDDDDDEAKPAAKKPTTAAERRIAFLNKRARGELSGQSSSSDSSTDDDSGDEAAADDDDDEDDDKPKEDIPMGEETKRFAVMNCDWSRMRAVDLFALFQSFLPASGVVESVTIYPSDFGLTRMADEATSGPKGLWVDDESKDDDDDDDSKDESESEDELDEDDPLGLKTTAETEDDGFDKEKLRAYELEKLRYYYAVANFNSVAAAAAVFEQCDGLEYETSSNLLDLRFVPDDVTFANTPKESASSMPESYTPAIFATLALQNTDIECTWDQDDGERQDKLTRMTNWKELKDDDFDAYVASDASNQSDDDADKGADLDALKKKYRKALLGSDAEDDDDDDDEDGRAKASAFGDDVSDDEGGMEMTFNDATDVLKAKKQRDLEASETPFEKYQREKKHEKNLKKHDKRQQAKEAHTEQLETLKQAKKTKKKVVAANAGGDDDDDARDFDMKVIQKLEKHKEKKGKHHKKEAVKLQSTASGLQQDFSFNAEDSRFAQLVTNNPDFSLDPTDARFKRTEATEAIFETRRKRQQGKTLAAAVATDDDKPNELKSIVENLKRKAKSDATKPKKKANRF
ncbi:Aste57867_23876 [Aphanomyces stellatus]|uniref:Aste57867_23876 protein n=1 Tax=Aphanomyces stellatus TaxID=120398 RepID=A0A485LPN8_9STRA|nr:hypothetical protein As57867_023803 [Aphanomyces stellatus]VFU00519.1 Aste57867_23876 [Aphanomyces stellatus]